MVGVLVATVVQLAGRGVDLSTAGVVRVLEVAAYWSVPSVVLINQPQLPDGVGGGLGHMLVHTLLAVHLLTGVLALRALIKSQ